MRVAVSGVFEHADLRRSSGWKTLCALYHPPSTQPSGRISLLGSSCLPITTTVIQIVVEAEALIVVVVVVKALSVDGVVEVVGEGAAGKTGVDKAQLAAVALVVPVVLVMVAMVVVPGEVQAAWILPTHPKIMPLVAFVIFTGRVDRAAEALTVPSAIS